MFEGKETHKGLLEGELIVVVRVFLAPSLLDRTYRRCMPDRREQHKGLYKGPYLVPYLREGGFKCALKRM